MEEAEAPEPDPATLTDKQLLDTYQATTGTPGVPAADRLIAKIQRRELDI